MADVAQLVRALVCGTRCREFESHLPPHFLRKGSRSRPFLLFFGMKMKSGFLIINKERGVSSAKVVSVIKHIIKPKKIGHAGTLDPLAEGVLAVAVNEATKLVRFVEDGIKEYVFDIAWGSETATDDMEGEVIAVSDRRPSLKELNDILPFFTGKIKQIPPKYSAIKINGKRAYALARGNADFSMKEREVRIDDLKVVSHGVDSSRLKVVCHKGTYVRSLARDIARKLSSCGHVSFLQRSKVGKFSISDAILLSNLQNVEHNLESFLVPLSTLLDDILAFAVGDKEAADLLNGRKISIDAVNDRADVVITHKGKLVAIADIRDGVVMPKRIIFDD